MSKAEKTKEFIIQKAAPIFNMKGYAGTSLQDLTKATGLTKGSLYGNFESKNDIAIAVYQYSVDSLNKRISDFLITKPSALQQLFGLTEFYRLNWKRVFENGGCPVQNASVEADDNLTFLKKHVQNTIKHWAKGISKTIEKGQRDGDIKTNINPVDYAYTIITQLEGGIMMGKIMNSQKLFFSALNRVDDMIRKEIKK